MPMIPPPPPSVIALDNAGSDHVLGTQGMVVLTLGVTFTVVMIVIALAIIIRTELDNRRSGRP